MQITTNTTGMSADISVATDKDGEQHCVVVVKGTFVVDQNGKPALAEEQSDLAPVDQHYGEPASTSVRYECDFAHQKPRTDVVVLGEAYAPEGRAVTEMEVGLAVKTLRKVLMVTGDRYWHRGIAAIRPSSPRPFRTMPIIYERAFGGSDHSHSDPKYHSSELRNPVGVGFMTNPDHDAAEGRPLPNIEFEDTAMRSCYDKPCPAGFGVVARAWQPRLKHAGTYDQAWLDEVFPFLPNDFDPQCFQCAPRDQQLPYLRGGEVIACSGLTAAGTWTCEVPRQDVPVTYRFRNTDVRCETRLDTIVVEPARKRITVCWRASTPIGRKLTALREIEVGRIRDRPVRWHHGKPHFDSLEALANWRSGRRVDSDSSGKP